MTAVLILKHLYIGKANKILLLGVDAPQSKAGWRRDGII